MARASQARCLHCGVRLPLYRKLTDGGFCSAAHRKAYQEDQSRMAVERLMETQQMLSRASEKARAQQHPLPPPVPAPVAPPECGLMSISPSIRLMAAPDIIAVDPIVYDFGGEPVRPAPQFSAAGCTLPEARGVPVFTWRSEAVGFSSGGSLRCPAPQPVAARIAGNRPAAFPTQPPLAAFAGYVSLAEEVRRLPKFDPQDNADGHCREPHSLVGEADTPLLLTASYPSSASDRTAAGLSPLKCADAPLRPLPKFDPHDNAADRSHELHALEGHGGTWLPLPASYPTSNPRPAFAGLAQLELTAAPLNRVVRLHRIDSLAAPNAQVLFPLASPAAVAGAPSGGPAMAGLLPLAAPEFVRAGGCRLPESVMPLRAALRPQRPEASGAQASRSELRPAGLHALNVPASVEPPPAWILKGRDWSGTIAGASAPTIPVFIPSMQQMLLNDGGVVAVPLGDGVSMPHTPGLARRAIQPAAAFPWVIARPAHSCELAPMEAGDFVTLGASLAPAAVVARTRKSARSVGEFFHSAPWSIRLMALFIPALAMIALRPVSARPDKAGDGPVGRFVNTRLTEVRSAIQSRAGVEMLDDFRTGLDNWESSRDLTRSWSYDQTGFVRPGPIALYRPSIAMTDYDFEFLGQIDRKALGWVFRASDLENYYVAKLVVLRSGPLPAIGLQRYAVVNGKQGPRTETQLPLNVHQDTVYRVRMEVRGPNFSLYVQNQLVQYWNDSRLKTGGVGFFSASGEQSRVRWMQVSHQYDTLGRLCAYFAPMAVVTYDMQPAMGAGTK